MTNAEKQKELADLGRRISHPGQIFKNQYLTKMGLSTAFVARSIGVKRETLRDFAIGRTDMTPDLAIRLGRFFQTAFEFWVNMQHSFDHKHTVFTMSERHRNIKPYKHKVTTHAQAQNVPVRTGLATGLQR